MASINQDGSQDNGHGVGFPQQNCDGDSSPMRTDLTFPNCRVNSAKLSDYKNNAVYPTNGLCPSGTTKYPILHYETYWNTMDFAGLWETGQGTQPWVFSMGDPTGYGYHGDFVRPLFQLGQVYLRNETSANKGRIVRRLEYRHTPTHHLNLRRRGRRTRLKPRSPRRDLHQRYMHNDRPCKRNNQRTPNCTARKQPRRGMGQYSR